MAKVFWGVKADWDASLYRKVLMCSNCGFLMDLQNGSVPEPLGVDYAYSPEGEIIERGVWVCPRCGVNLDEVEPIYVTIWRELPGVADALDRGEGQRIEFKSCRERIQKRHFPKDLSKQLTESIAAFATSNPGIIYLGIENDGTVTGVNTDMSEDEFGLRIAELAKNRVKPSLSGVEVKFLTHTVEGEEKTVIAIAVPEGSEPVYYTEANIPYLRDGRRKRPAEPHEVKELITAHKKAKRQISRLARS